MLQKIRKFLTIEKAKILGSTFIDSQFNYAPLIWMFCRKTFYSKIEKIHHRTLKVVHGIDDSYNLLLKSNSVSVHQRHLQLLVTEIIKSISQITPEFMWSFFKSKKLSYNLRKGPILNLPRTQSTYTSQMLFTLEVLLYEIIFRLKLNPAIQFSNLKPNLKIWEILIVDV